MQFRAEAFNLSNTPRLFNLSGNISCLQLKRDGTFRVGVFEVTGVGNTGREGTDEKVFRFGLRIGFSNAPNTPETRQKDRRELPNPFLF